MIRDPRWVRLLCGNPLTAWYAVKWNDTVLGVFCNFFFNSPYQKRCRFCPSNPPLKSLLLPSASYLRLRQTIAAPIFRLRRLLSLWVDPLFIRKVKTFHKLNLRFLFTQKPIYFIFLWFFQIVVNLWMALPISVHGWRANFCFWKHFLFCKQ